MVYQVTTNTYGTARKSRTFDLHEVRLADGTKAVKLPQPDLYRAIKDIVPDVVSTMGWQELALRLAFWQAERQEANEAECQ
jgi:hypothetical protein